MLRTVSILLLSTWLIASCKCNNNKAYENNTACAAIDDKNAINGNTNSINGSEILLTGSNTLPIDNSATTLTTGKHRLKHRTNIPGFFPEGSERRLNENDIVYLTEWGHKVMLNEIYARHGMRFRDEQLNRHFMRQKWYHPRNGNVYAGLTPIEKQNISFLINNNKYLAIR